jgi:hypothetical protein
MDVSDYLELSDDKNSLNVIYENYISNTATDWDLPGECFKFCFKRFCDFRQSDAELLFETELQPSIIGFILQNTLMILYWIIVWPFCFVIIPFEIICILIFGNPCRKIGSKGDVAVLKHLAQALSTCSLPIHVRFIFCNLSKEGVLALHEALRKNTTLIGFTEFGNVSKEWKSLLFSVIGSHAPLVIFNNNDIPYDVKLLKEIKRQGNDVEIVSA